MKKSFKVLAAVLAAALVLAGCSSATSSTPTTTTVAVKAIKATESSISVLPGKTAQINVTFTPTNATNKALTYTVPSSGTSAITVSSSGLVTASASATLGASIKVAIKSADGSKVDNVTVKIEKAVAASTVTKTTTAVAPTTTTAANGKAVPTKAAVGTTKTKTVGSSSTGNSALSFAQIAAKAEAIAKAPRATTSSSSLYSAVYSPVAGLVVLVNNNASALAELGLLPVDATFDPTATASDTGVDKTVTVTSTIATAFGLTTGDSVILKNWKYHTLDATNADGTENTYYTEGYTQEIYFELGGKDYWLDFTDDATMVLVEYLDTTTNESLIVTGDFNNAYQGFEYSKGSLAYSFDEYFDSSNATLNGAWGSVAFDAWDDTTSTGVTASVDGYVDDLGAFLIGFLATGDAIDTNAVGLVEELSAADASSGYTQKYLASVPVADDGTLGAVTIVSGTFVADDSYTLKLYGTGIIHQ